MATGLLLIGLVVLLIGSVAFKIWRVVTFAKLTKTSLWKAFLVLGK